MHPWHEEFAVIVFISCACMKLADTGHGPEQVSLVRAPAITANRRALAELRNLCFGRYTKVWWPIFFGAAVFFLIHLQFSPDTESQNVQFSGWKKAIDWLWIRM